MNTSQKYTLIVCNFGAQLAEQEADLIRQAVLQVCAYHISTGAITTPFENIEVTFISTLYAVAYSEGFNAARIRNLVSNMVIPPQAWSNRAIFLLLPDDSTIAAAIILEIYRRGAHFPFVLRRRKWVELGIPMYAVECIPLHRFFEGEQVGV